MVIEKAKVYSRILLSSRLICEEALIDKVFNE